MTHDCCHNIHPEASTPEDSHSVEAGTVFSCPMHPEVTSDKPGLCSECGMALLKQKYEGGSMKYEGGKEGKHGEHDKHKGHSTNIFRVKFWVSLVLTIPIFLYSEMAEMLFGLHLPDLKIGNLPAYGIQAGWELGILFPALLGTAVFFYGGWVFLVGAYRELKAKLPGMMTLISLAIVTAYSYSLYVVALGILFRQGSGGQALFFELSSLVTIMLLGHWIEMRAVSGAQGALKELSKLLPDKAILIIPNSQFPIHKSQTPNSRAELATGQANYNTQITNEEGETREVFLEELKIGDVVLVKPGAKVPADGVIVEGQSELNESLLTGESKPVSKKPGDEVIAGSQNGDGSLVVEIKKIGEETFLSGIKRLVADAQASKSRLQQLADRAALLLTVVAVVAGGLTVSTWLFLGAGMTFAVSRLVAVLVVACPHALGLAIPLVASISTTKGAQNGVLVRERLALESARTIDTVLFDKTGTLTKGEYGVTDILPVEGTADEIVSRAASVDYYSEHPIASAMVREAKERKLKPVPASKFERIPGKGAQAIIDGMTVKVGSYALLKDDGVAVPVSVKEKLTALAKEGKTIIFVLSGRVFSGALALADVVRPESEEAIKELHKMGIKVAMVTGDSEEVAKYISDKLGLEEYYARVLPGEKAEKVKMLQNKGARVAFVGDGVNDAPALTEATLGIAIGAGTNVAIESAGIILVKNDPRDIPRVIRLSRFTYRKMIQNLWWAAGYNIIAIPLAAGVLAPWGIFLEPAIAAVLMSVSTVVVAFNAVLLHRQKI